MQVRRCALTTMGSDKSSGSCMSALTSNSDGQTALMFAAMNRKDTIIRLLLNRGALPNMKVGHSVRVGVEWTSCVQPPSSLFFSHPPYPLTPLRVPPQGGPFLPAVCGSHFCSRTSLGMTLCTMPTTRTA